VWIFKYLTDHPDVQKTLREEVQTAFAQARDENRLPTAKEIIASLRQLPYLRAVIEEMLRLRQAMMVPRDAARDTEILGCRIPKGTPIFLVCQGPDPRTLKTVSGKPVRAYGEYPGKGSQDMGMFDPERWLVRKSNGEVEFDGRTYPQLAFGGGLRACWGRKLADMEMQIVTTLLVWKFDFMSVPDALSTHEATYDITYRAVNGYLNVRSRAT
jgi:cytochrome P450